jgi:predicted nuclease of restriction endonuclease-like (RecB) superfamily
MKKKPDTTIAISADYRQFIEELKSRVMSAQITAARRINHELILLYWDIGRGIVEKQQALGWGESVVEMVAADLQRAFPSMSGFSPRNVWDMKRFYLAYSDEAIWRQAVAKLTKGAKDPEIWSQPVAKLEGDAPNQFLPQLVAEIPWGHHRFILDKLADPAARLWYLRATARFGWSRNVLLNQIKASAYERAVTEKKTHNFDLALPEHFAEQAEEMLKSSYSLEFLGLRRAVKERELEDRLVSRLQSFLLELGYGFCFVGRQYRGRSAKRNTSLISSSTTASSRPSSPSTSRSAPSSRSSRGKWISI